MKILIIGSGGREHALANAYAKSKKVKKVFIAPGNDFMQFENKKLQTLPDIKTADFKKIIAFAKKENVALVDVAQEDPLAAGLVDLLTNESIEAFGPFKNAAEIEWNKDWARMFMAKFGLPIPRYKSFSDTKTAIGYLNKLPEQVLFIKAAGLALGKGVIRTENKKEAENAIRSMKKFGKAGTTFLIEHALVGEEFSLFALCDGEQYKILGVAQDHKTVYEKDKGPNTGGMGCVAPTNGIAQKNLREIETKILTPFMQGMKEEGRPYTGILYLGGMIDQTGQNEKIHIVEFNARWGDPEAEVILPGIKNDYLDLIFAATMKQLHTVIIKTDNKMRVSVAASAAGYPQDYSESLGKEIFGISEVMKLPGITLYGAGIKRQGRKFVVNGGRILHLVAEGATIEQARRRAYEAMSILYIEGDNLHFRTDIGWRELERKFLIKQ